MKIVIIVAAFTLTGCAKTDVQKCVDARMAAFDEKYPAGVSTTTGKTRTQAKSDNELLCLYASQGRQ